MANLVRHSTATSGNVPFYLSTQYQEAPKPAVDDSRSSTGALDAALVHQDAMRSKEILRPTLFQMVILGGYHGKAASQLKDHILPSRVKYAQYLAGLKHDLMRVEMTLKNNPPINLEPLYRTAAIDADLMALKVTAGRPFRLVAAYRHAKHFASIADQPHRLIAYFAVHCLGFLYGGQTTSKRLQENAWGKDCVAVYQFADCSKVLTAFSNELTSYLHALPEGQYQEFREEIETAWQFSCDVEDLNTRQSSSKNP